MHANRDTSQSQVPAHVATSATDGYANLPDDPFWSGENQNRLLAAKRQYESEGGTVHELVEIEDE